MEGKGWNVEKVHGSLYMQGWPDLYCFHPVHGKRWVEMKTPTGCLRPSQIKRFEKWEKFGDKVWVLDGHSEEDYRKLFKPPNWRLFIRGKAR